MRLALARLCHASDLDSSVVAPRGKDQRRYPHMIAHRAARRCSFFVLSLPEGCKASARLEDLRLAGFINGCQTGFGWTAGAGIEAAFTDNLTARIEYLFVDLGDATCNTTFNCGLDKTNTGGERHGKILKQHHPAGRGLQAPLT
jgi:hypothetical protein